MQIDQQQLGTVIVLKPSGPLTHDTADAFRQRVVDVLQSQPSALVVDTSEVSYIDSEGLEALIDARQELVKQLQVLRLCGSRETLRDVLDMTGLREMFEHFEDVTTAVRSTGA